MPVGYDETRNEMSSLLDSLKGANSAFAGISGASDVKKRYGLKDSKSIYDPLKRSLASSTGKAMAGASLAGGRNATPGMTFSAIKSGSNQALSNILSEQGRTDAGQQGLIAQLLNSAFGGQDQFALGKSGQMGSLLQGMAGLDLQREQLDAAMEDPGFLDYLMGVIPGLLSVGLSPVAGGGTVISSLFGMDKPSSMDGLFKALMSGQSPSLATGTGMPGIIPSNRKQAAAMKRK